MSVIANIWDDATFLSKSGEAVSGGPLASGFSGSFTENQIRGFRVQVLRPRVLGAATSRILAAVAAVLAYLLVV
ncbi:hypothetical protein WG66_006228 [Moniliophthora roreri]|nr:hypothetical protein WG66_006228 [Moniliophthora roreri]